MSTELNRHIPYPHSYVPISTLIPHTCTFTYPHTHTTLILPTHPYHTPDSPTHPHPYHTYRGDHTTASCNLFIVPHHTEVVVFSVDGALASNFSLSAKDIKIKPGAVEVAR